MEAPPRTDRCRTVAARAIGKRFAALLALLSCTLLPGTAFAQRNDQVWFVDRDGSVRQTSGVVTENSTATVRVKRGADRESTYDGDRVRRIEWGQVTTDFREGREYRDRGDHLNAARKFREAATNTDERIVVQAAARLLAAQSLLDLGATEPVRIGEALSELETFLSDFANNRDVQRARHLQAQAIWLDGRAGEAAEAFRSLFEEGSGASPTPGFDRQLSLDAGLAAGRAFLAAGDSLRAKEIFGALDSAATTFAGQFAESSPERLAAERLATEARLGDGFVMLAAGQVAQAVPFFEARRSQGDAAMRHAADLGLGEAYLAQNKLREAQVKFASVSALDFSDRYRAARARLKLAETHQKLADSASAALARKLLTEVVERYGDTPAAREARTLLES